MLLGTANVLGDPSLFPPETQAAVVHLACQKPGTAMGIKGCPDPEKAQNRLGTFLSQSEDGEWQVTVPVGRLSAYLISWLLVNLALVGSISARTVARWLKAQKLKPWRFRSWITPKSLPEFLPRARDVLDLYYHVRTGLDSEEIVWCVDECTSLQARARDSHALPKPGGEGHLVESSYRRMGAVQLFAALDVATGYVKGTIKQNKTFLAFQEVLEELIGFSVQQGKRVIRFVLDNGSTHRPAYLQNWLSATYPNLNIEVTWLPVRSSWLNQVEIFLSVLKAYVLKINAFEDTETMGKLILDFIDLGNLQPRPIDWTYTSEALMHKYGLWNGPRIWVPPSGALW